MKHLVHKDHPFRIFVVSASFTLVTLGLVWHYLGLHAAFIALVLMLVEITFSFENAIINAKVLSGMSIFWQRLFMTVGILIAVIGMRLVFPVIIVMLTAGLGAKEVIDLALHEPTRYAEALHDAHISIASFGGMFLLMLCFNFFFDGEREIRWVHKVEAPLQKYSKWWIYTGVALAVLSAITLLPWNHEPQETFVAGMVGIGTYLTIRSLTDIFTRSQRKRGQLVQTGLAGFLSFIYLEILDASFSFDGVIGAFAVTKDVVLIAAGLGIGALWVRSLTLFMVRRRVLSVYRYLEHGAHYTIGVLSAVLIAGIFLDVPELIAGLAGILLITLAVANSIVENKREEKSLG